MSSITVLAVAGWMSSAAAELRVPAFTAYLSPADGTARVSERSGVTGWDDPAVRVLWFGELMQTGGLRCSVSLKLPGGAESRLRLTVAGQAREVAVQGGGSEPIRAQFDGVVIARPGYQCFALESMNAAGRRAGDLDALILEGPAVSNARFNLRPRRNAASVHLRYPVGHLTNLDAFYCEVTALEDPAATFYMACGWHRGYFGMQVNSATERRIIFSVWDSAREADRSHVGEADRVRLVAKGEGVQAGDFGNEGTGGHSHLVYPWRTGEIQRFVVTAKPLEETHTIFAGYFFRPDEKRWMLISSWKAPKDGGYLRGLHSFSENFGGENGHLRRKAMYGNQWVRPTGGPWSELTTATFSHDQTGKADRLDRFMGVEDGRFFLSQGGFVPGFTQYGEIFRRAASGEAPIDLAFPLAGQ